MPRNIEIKAGDVTVDAVIADSKAGQAILDALPIRGTANTWGDEIYFSIPVDVEGENLTEVVQLGDLAFWPPGHAFCIFFGPTPASRGDEIRAASGVEVVGHLLGSFTALRQVKSGAPVAISKADSL